MTKTERRFWKKVDRHGPKQPHMPTRCWVWTGAITADGYGNFYYRGRCYYAHRFSFYLRRGHHPVNEGCHKCDFRSCVRPSHIFDGTRGQNAQDASRKGRLPRGESHRNAKIRECDVQEIKTLRAQGVTCREVAEKFGIGQMQVSRIARGLRWAHTERTS